VPNRTPSSPPRPAAHRSGRRVSLGPGAVLFWALFATQASILVLTPILPDVAAEFGVSTASAAQLRSLAGIVAALAALYLARVGDRLPLGVILASGLGLLGVGSLTSALAPSFQVMLGAHVVIGLGLAAVLAGGFAASEAWAAPGDRSRVLSRALIGQPVAWIVGQPIVGFVGRFDWRWTWIVVPVTACLVALVALRLRDPSIGDEGENCDPVGLWRAPGVKTWAISEFIAFAAWGGALVYAGSVLIEAYGLDIAMTGLILGAGAVFYLPGNSLGRRWVELGTARLMIGFSLLAGLAVIVFSTTLFGLPLAVAGFAAAVFFAAGRSFAGAARGLQVADGRRLAAMSVRASADQLGYLAGTAVGGILLETWGFPGMGFGFAALFVTAALVLVGPARTMRHRLPDPRQFLRRTGPVPGS
jgi:MFS transporter, DHA1 family, inner membrane transport protein